ncbi:MAG: proprotein convertase P-domain-containing protein [Lutibacter sp.]|uniref:proprotein convertase P-domain-containing protein n=1 Tax=Lutibacter sp. TaxID=1925666 RepID=UPI00385F419A
MLKDTFIYMKPKKYYIKFLLLFVVAFSSLYFFVKYNDAGLEVVRNEKAKEKREQYAKYLENSPFKKTLKLTKEQRKSQGLPPNKYYEREWELTMNPATGKPEPYKVLSLQKRLHDKSLASRAPGDAVDNAWEERGPNNVGGRTRVVLFDPNDVTNKRVFAGGVSGGLWVNDDITNSGSVWTQVSGVPGNMNISCITVDPNNSNTWYMGTGEQYTFGAAVGNGVYKTTDGGANWVNVPVQLAGGGTSGTDFAGIFFINDIVAWDNVGSTELFIGIGTHVYGDANPTNWLGFQNAGLYKSNDDGVSWSRMEASNLELTPGSSYYTIPNDFEISADNTLWFGSIRTPGTSDGGGKVFSSTDGATWTQVTTLTTSDRVEIAVSSTDANKIYALTEGDGTDPHIFVTTDAFSNTTELTTPADADTGVPNTDFTRGQDFYDLVIEVDPTNDAIVYVGGIDLFRSQDSGSNWSQISKWSNNNNLAALTCSIVHADQHAFTFRSGVGGNNEAVIGCDGGIYYASSLSTAETNDVFAVMNTEYNVTQFYYGGYGPDTANELIIAGAQDNGSHFINGASSGTNSSVDVFGGDGAYSTIDKDGDYMIVSYVYNTHYYYDLPYSGGGYSIDNGSTEGDFINPAGLDHNLNIMYSNGSAGATKQINRYTLGSASATKLQLTHALLTGSPTAFKVSPYTTTSTTLLVGTDDSKLLKLTTAEATPTWADISGGSFVGSVSAVEFGATENDIFVTFHNYGVTSVWYSADGGTNWISKEGDLPDMPVKCILQNPLALNEVIIGTDLGIWSTSNFDNASPTWVSSQNGMMDVKVVDLDVRTSDNSILATTFGRGVFTGQFTGTDFSFTAQSSTVSTCTPNDAVFTFDFTATPSYNTATTFSTTGEPAGVSITFSPTSLNATGTFTMTVGNIGAVATGEYTITVIGTGNDTYSTDVVLKVVDSNFGILTATAPVNEATGIAISSLVFDWNADTNATSYDIDIATDAGFNTIIETANVVTNSYTSTLNLNYGTIYYWKVRAINSCANGDYSATQKFQTAITCNTLTNNTSMAIPDGIGANTAGAAAESIITVADDITVSDINVTINISHTYIQDLVISVIAPDATEIVLFDRECNGENDISATYDDAAAATITCDTPVTGTNIPTNLLSGFNGKSSLGDWTLKVLDYYNVDTGTINSWSIEICQTQTITNSTFTNSPITVGANGSYTLIQAETEATSVGSIASEQVYMLAVLPTVGEVRLNNVALTLGETFTQADINTSKVTYVNSSGVSTVDSFKVDITNATGGFLPNQQVNITIDAALAIDNYFFEKTGISVYPTISNGDFSISSSKGIGKTSVEMYSITGQKVFMQELNFNSGNVEHINAQNLTSGIYILKLSTDNLQGSKKLIIK